MIEWIRMKIGLMQPYLFPHLGYFQLISACDKFVIHDDVQYIRQGWINRYNIIVHKRKFLFVFSVKHDDYSKNINERFYMETFNVESKKLLRNISQSYSKAPFYADVQPLLGDVFGNPERNVALFNISSLRKICRYLSIDTEIIISSDLAFDKSLTKEARVIEINKLLRGNHYINPIGGLDLYSKERFLGNGIELSFLKSILNPYQQSIAEFLPGLSIIDVIMNCSKDRIFEMLRDFELV